VARMPASVNGTARQWISHLPLRLRGESGLGSSVTGHFLSASWKDHAGWWKSEGLIGRIRGNHVHTSADATRLAGAGDETTATRSAGVPVTRPAIGRAEYWAFIRRRVRDTWPPFSKLPTEMTSDDGFLEAKRSADPLRFTFSSIRANFKQR